MMTPGLSAYSLNQSAVDDAESQLQQELRALFAVDTQQHLQTYFTLVQSLNPQAWAADIQHLYRAVHTIKGSAVTVEADAMLHAGMVLEDMLSDLRYLDPPPILEDGQLSKILLEAGDLLSSSLEITATGDQAVAQVQPTVQRLQHLHAQVKERYIPDWSELKQVHQEFAEQGLGLVVLELEMVLGELTSETLSLRAIEVALKTLNQLTTIGQDLEMAEGWTIVLQRYRDLTAQTDSRVWQRLWPQLFADLQDCAKQGGILNGTGHDHVLVPEAAQAFVPESFTEHQGFEPEVETILSPSDVITSPDRGMTAEMDWSSLDLPDPATLDFLNSGSKAGFEGGFDTISEDAFQDLSSLLEESGGPDLPNLQDLTALEKLEALTNDGLQPGNLEDLNPIGETASEDDIDLLGGLETLGELSNLDDFSDFGDLDSFDNLIDLESLDDLNGLDQLNGLDDSILTEATVPPSTIDFNSSIDFESTTADIGLFPAPKPSPELTQPIAEVSETPALAKPELSVPKRDVQIPVPLERLDHSAQQVVETLLSARAVMNSSQKLQEQMMQLTSLTQESAQFVTRLRQLQDDYALLRNLSDEKDSNNLTLERYRQGYSTINRLLENILRMSELGQEIETVTQQSVGRLDKLDRSILHLKDGIESSRLVPFLNLALRSRAILRDLTNRYGKPVELAITGEQVELDAGIVQQLEPLLLHLLRNAYDHGIETPEERLSSGKPVEAKIFLALQRRGNLYRLTLQDDGRGIDSSAIEQQAQHKGFPLTQTRTAAELLAVLCQPGFSSRSSVSEVSGRGVGMDVVASQILAMGGRLSLQTHPGQGTSFTIEIPAPQLLVPCVLLQVGDRTVALPTDEILETVLASSIEMAPERSEQKLCTWTLTASHGEAQGFELSRYWSPHTQLSQTQRALSDTAICIRIRPREDATTAEAEHKIPWLIADDLLRQEDLLINPLPNPLVAPQGLLGVSLQPDGCLISVLDPVALAEAIRSAPRAIPNAVSNAESSPAVIETPSASVRSSVATILVVDDAALMRRRMEGSLQTYGFETHTCGDGIEALNWLQNNGLPDLMITDVEMPNMDGFTLIDRCRQSHMQVPILVVSSRVSEEWGREAQRLGANDYLNKGFTTAELIQKVNQCLVQTPAAVS